MEKKRGFLSKTFDAVNFIKEEWKTSGIRATEKYHEDELYSAILKAGKKYYKDPILAYEEHVWTYAAVWAVANAAAMLSCKMYDYDEDGKKIELEKHWLLDLLKYPNANYTGYDLMEGTFTYLELFGDAYWEVVTNKKDEITGLYLLRTDRVKVIGDEKRMIKAYIYSPNEIDYVLAPSEVIHFKNFSPRSEINGQGAVKAAQNALEKEFLGNETSKDFFRRGAVPSFVIEVPARMSDPAYKRFRNALKHKHQGVGKMRDILLLEEGSKYVQTELSPLESGESEIDIKARQSVAASVGVPPIKLQLLDGAAYANARFQDLSFWRNTMEPKLTKFYAKINLDFLRSVNSTAWIQPDLIKVLMNIDEFKNEVDAYTKMVEKGIMTRNEVRERVHLDQMDGGDILTVNPNIVPLTDVISPVDITEDEEVEEEG